jgi:hypothetical protein
MAVKVQCRQHPRYRAILRPKHCGTCELLYDLVRGATVSNEARKQPYTWSELESLRWAREAARGA